MTPPNMPTFEMFLEATTVRLGGKLGFGKLGPVLARGRLEAVDTELYNWWALSPSNYDRKIASSIRLIQKCADWSQKHQGDGGTRTGAQRSVAVNNLVVQCRRSIAQIYINNGKLKSMHSSYGAERTAYKNAKTANQKINPVGGSFVHDFQKTDLPPELANTPVALLHAKPMNLMTPADFAAIADALLPASERHLADTTYLNGDDRQGYSLLIRNGVFCKPDGNPLTRPVAYAMSKYGTIYGFDLIAASNFKTSGNPAGFFNHSSFMAGKDVVCAGVIDNFIALSDAQEFQKYNGTWHISTESGHYKPSADNLKNCLKALKASGLDLSQYLARVVFPQPTHMESAATFIQ